MKDMPISKIWLWFFAAILVSVVLSVALTSYILGSQPKASATEMLEKLGKARMVIYEKCRGIILTEEGKKTAATINQRYKIFLRLFEIAGVSPKTAYRDACILEHYISDETDKAIQNLVERLESVKTKF